MDGRPDAEATHDGGFEIRRFNTCMSEFFEAVMVNGEHCYFGDLLMAHHPEYHLHNSKDEAIACAQQRLRLGLTMPGPQRG